MAEATTKRELGTQDLKIDRVLLELDLIRKELSVIKEDFKILKFNLAQKGLR